MGIYRLRTHFFNSFRKIKSLNLKSTHKIKKPLFYFSFLNLVVLLRFSFFYFLTLSLILFLLSLLLCFAQAMIMYAAFFREVKGKAVELDFRKMSPESVAALRQDYKHHLSIENDMVACYRRPITDDYLGRAPLTATGFVSYTCDQDLVFIMHKVENTSLTPLQIEDLKQTTLKICKTKAKKHPEKEMERAKKAKTQDEEQKKVKRNHCEIWIGTTMCNNFRRDNDKCYKIALRNEDGQFCSNSKTLEVWNQLQHNTPVSVVIDDYHSFCSGDEIDIDSYSITKIKDEYGCVLVWYNTETKSKGISPLLTAADLLSPTSSSSDFLLHFEPAVIRELARDMQEGKIASSPVTPGMCLVTEKQKQFAIKRTQRKSWYSNHVVAPEGKWSIGPNKVGQAFFVSPENVQLIKKFKGCKLIHFWAEQPRGLNGEFFAGHFVVTPYECDKTVNKAIITAQMWKVVREFHCMEQEEFGKVTFPMAETFIEQRANEEWEDDEEDDPTPLQAIFKQAGILSQTELPSWPVDGIAQHQDAHDECHYNLWTSMIRFC